MYPSPLPRIKIKKDKCRCSRILRYIGRHIESAIVNFSNLSSNSLLTVDEISGNDPLNYQTDVKVRTLKRMSWQVNGFSHLWRPMSRKLIVSSTWKFIVVDVSPWGIIRHEIQFQNSWARNRWLFGSVFAIQKRKKIFHPTFFLYS